MTPPATSVARPARRPAPSRARTPRPHRPQSSRGGPGIRHARRISGPARPVAAAATAAVLPAPGIALRAIDLFDIVSSSALLDRLIRSRIWIGLLAFALIGIVTMQLLVLQLNTHVGHTLVREAALERQNAQLGVENSMSAGENQIAPLASAAGMRLAPAGTVHFVVANPADLTRAAAALSATVQVPASGASESTASGEAGATGEGGGTSEVGASGEGGATSEGQATGAGATGPELESHTTSPSAEPASSGGGSSSSTSGEEGSTSGREGTSAGREGSTAGGEATSPAGDVSSAGSEHGASAAPSGGTGASGTSVNGSGGGTQAGGSRE